MGRVVHFEIHASDPERAAEFYRAVFGWQVNEWVVPGVEVPYENRYWMVGTGSGSVPGIDGGLLIKDTEGNLFGILQNDPAAA